MKKRTFITMALALASAHSELLSKVEVLVIVEFIDRGAKSFT